MMPASSLPTHPRRRRDAVLPSEMPRSASIQRAGEAPQKRRRYLPRPTAAAALLCGSLLAAAAPAHAEQAVSSPRAACLDAARAAEAVHGLPRGLMVAVALAEFGLHAYALNIGGRSHFPSNSADARRLLRNAGAGQSVMAGCVQINAKVHAPGADWPLDPRRAADWGAQHLREKFDLTGNWGDAIRRWNGGPAADKLVCRVQAKLRAANPSSSLLSGERCGAGYARERRDGRELLEIAEASDR